MHLNWLIIVVLLTSCHSYDVHDHYDKSELLERIKISDEGTERLRLEAESKSLSEKATYFESKILKEIHPKYKFVPKHYYSDRKDQLRTDMTSHLLAALAFKYGVTKSSQDLKLIEDMVDTFIAADKTNGYDGFLPYKVMVKDGSLVATDNETHENIYVQLFFAYVIILRNVEDENVLQKVKSHSETILKHFAKQDFVLYTHEGEEADYSDLSLTRYSLYKNRKLSLLSLLDYGLLVLDDGSLKTKLLMTRKEAEDLGYEETVLSLHTAFLNREFPTHSSSWLNFLKIYNGWHSSGNEIYKKAFMSLYENYEDERNPFLELMKASLFDSSIHESVESILSSFPLTLTSREVINSPSFKDAEFGNYVKIKRHRETQEILPVYQRPLNNFLWKRNPMIVDGNFESSGQTTYSGIDFLQAYWFMRFLRFSTN
ncbi:MAG: hypothetical protein NE334_09140 [Lentisphaeraceae bacterium]|nr:hypothetical protein [Lentisphaeraceae bacterium]